MAVNECGMRDPDTSSSGERFMVELTATAQVSLESILGSPHYLRWASALQPNVTADPLWRVSAYRLSSYLGDMAWDDARALWLTG